MDTERLAPCSGEFVDRVRERAYRRAQAAAELRQIRIIWLVAVLCFLLYLPADYWLFARRATPTLLTLRIVIIVIGTTAVLAMSTRRGARWRDVISGVCLAVVSLCYALMLHERPGVNTSPGALLLLVVGIYIFSPGRFRVVCANGLFCSAAALALGLLLHPERAARWLDYSYLVPANLLAALALAQLNRMRRRLYLQNRQLRAAVRARRSAQRELAALHERNLQLLHNALPAHIATQLSRHPDRKPARHHPQVTVLFADIVGFTALAGRISAQRLLLLLNTLFSRFDDLAAQCGLEKIKTVGDAYMAAAGIGDGGRNQQERAVRMALAQRECAAAVSRELGLEVRLRIGIHSGPVVSGVVGSRRYAFDIWGETVNVASRLQTAAPAGGILVSERTRRSCPPGLAFTPARIFELRGCGPVRASALLPELCGR
jgi:class 3 adenylate cyclase